MTQLLAAHVVFVVGAMIAVFIAPDRLQYVLYIESGGANEIVVPVGFGIVAALWAWWSLRTLRIPLRDGIKPAIAIAVAFHILLLAATFARQLPDPGGFSTAFYRIYARLFSAVLLAGAGWWSMSIVGRLRTNVRSAAALELPIVAGAVTLLSALIRYDVAVAGGGLLLLLVGALLERGMRNKSPFAELSKTINTEALFLVGLFLFAVALRVLYLRRVMSDPGYLDTGGDGATYDGLAWSIASGSGVPDSFRNAYPLLLLGYVWFVGAVYAIAGHSYFVIGVVQSVLGALACILLYVLCESLFGRAVARTAAVFTAVSFPLIFAAVAIGHQAVDVFLTLLATLLLWRMTGRESKQNVWHWAGIGILFGCLIAVRETNAFFLAFGLCWIAVLFRRSMSAGSVRAMVAVCAGVIVVIVPLIWPVASSAEGRLRLRQHFDRLYQGQGDVVRTRKDLAGPLEDPGAAVRQFLSDPGTVSGTVGRAIVHNFALQFFTQPFGGFDLVFLSKGSKYYYGVWFYAYALALAGLIVVLRQGQVGGIQAFGIALIIGVIVSRTIPHLVLESHYRHRVPIEPLLILLASIAAVDLMRAAREWHVMPTLMPQSRAQVVA